MTKKITFLLLALVIFSTTYSQRNPNRRSVGVHQLDPRFTFSIEKYWSGMADSEEYFYYVKNNTADEYMLEIEVDLTLNCYDAKPHKLGVNKQVYLSPYGEFTPKNDWVHIYMITSDREKQKSCLIAEGNTYTLYRGHTWQILSVVNLSQKKANEEKIKKEKEQARLQQIADEKKANEEKLRLQKIQSDQIAKQKADQERITKQKADAVAQTNTTKSSATNTGYPNNSTSRIPSGNTSTLSEKVKVNGQDVQVFQQNGKNYIKNADGSVHETTSQAYNLIMAQSDKKKAAAEANNTLTQNTATNYTNSIPQATSSYDSNTGYYSNPLANNLSNLNSGSSAVDNYAKSYAQGQQIAEVTTALIDLFTPSPEQQARKERERLEAERKAEEYRQIERQRRIENENNAKADFQKNVLDKYDSSNETDRTSIVIWGMDNYISHKYNYDIREMIPNWKNWMNQSLQNNNKYVSTVFAGKALGQNFNKFDYKLDLTTDQAIAILENVANSETEYNAYLGISWDIQKKTVKINQTKKKTITKEINTYVVNKVSEGSAAFKNDLKIGDQIIKVNNNYVDDVSKTIKSFKTGDKINLTFLRHGKEYTKSIILGGAIKDYHNVEAIIILANYYNTKATGNNPEKALYYYTKAAEAGSPNAMYALGEIYLKNVFGNKKLNVKYKFKKNEEFALEWYQKSILNPDYKTSTLQEYYNNGTYFEPKAFDELVNMYKKGIGCEKNTAKSNEILELKKSYTDQLEKSK
jgi:hypothetical protein